MSRPALLDNLDRIAPLLVLGATIAPWLLGYSSSRAAVADHVAFAFAFGPLAMLILALRPAAVACAIGGIWLALSPWLLGYAATGDAWGSDLLWGAFLAAASATALSPQDGS
jgi:SPW repeat